MSVTHLWWYRAVRNAQEVLAVIPYDKLGPAARILRSIDWYDDFLEQHHRRMYRAGGNMECSACGREYWRHVVDLDFPEYHLLCNGDWVHL